MSDLYSSSIIWAICILKSVWNTPFARIPVRCEHNNPKVPGSGCGNVYFCARAAPTISSMKWIDGILIIYFCIRANQMIQEASNKLSDMLSVLSHGQLNIQFSKL
jgi:hypothetical protein